jgi:hypothetical protein
MKRYLLPFIIILFCNIYSQENSFELFPSGLNFIPLKAMNRDAKIGLNIIPENNNMKINIGNTIDILSFRFSQSERITAAIDFFAYALSRSYRNKRLQIDAVDGLFGGNISYSKKINNRQFSGRLSIIHNSAHLVDGHWDRNENMWIDNYEPVPYAKDFIELITAYEYKTNFLSIRNYAGFEYAFLVRPSDMKRFNLNSGIEIGLTSLLSPLFGKGKVPFFAYNFTLNGITSYRGNYNSMLGIKFGNWNEKGILIFISYYEGYDVFHSYYKRRVKRFGVGFSVDFL